MELALAIESLIGSYLDDVRVAAQQAVTRATGTTKGPRAGIDKRVTLATSERRSRRTAATLVETCDTLCYAIRANPGASIAMLAEKMGAKSIDLQRPMAKLKLAGRVRILGHRRLTRYYPAVVRADSDQG